MTPTGAGAALPWAARERLRKAGWVGKARRLGVVLVLVMAAAGACGGDDDGGERLTSAELASRGDAVCNRLDGEVKKLAGEFPDTITFTPPQMQELFQKLVPKVDTAIEEFEDLTPPEDLEAKYDEALAQAGEDRKKLVAAGESPDAARTLFESGEDPFSATNEKLAAVGITACSDGGAGAEGDAGSGSEATTTTPAVETTTSSTP